MYHLLGQNLINLALACPFPLYVVGGRVRDYLAGLVSSDTDTDLCAPASAADFIACAERCGFEVTAAYKNTGTVKIKLGGEEYEFTSFRSDEYVRGSHVPANVCFTNDIALDARRRDFRCNALYYYIKAKKTVDPLGGVKDAVDGVLQTVAPPAKVFGEDGLRLMRLARIAAQTGFTPAENCLAAARENRKLIRDVSAERIFEELKLILSADLKYGKDGGPYRGLCILKNTGVLGEILPELAEGDGITQRADIHKYDVLEHSLRCAAYAPPEVRLAALLHDVGKPYCHKTYGNFINHGEAGAEIARKILKRLKVPKKQAEETVRLIALHMYDMRCDAREGKARKFIIANHDVLDKLFMLKQADYSACKDDFGPAPFVVKFKKIYGEMEKEGVPFTLKELKIKGGDLIAMGLAPRETGAALNRLVTACALKEVKNDGVKLKAYASKIFGLN